MAEFAGEANAMSKGFRYSSKSLGALGVGVEGYLTAKEAHQAYSQGNIEKVGKEVGGFTVGTALGTTAGIVACTASVACVFAVGGATAVGGFVGNMGGRAAGGAIGRNW